MKIKLLLIFLLIQSVTYADTSMSDLFNKYSNISVNSDSGEASSEKSENIVKTTNKKTSSMSDDFRKGQADAYAKGYSDAMSDCSNYGVKTKPILKFSNTNFLLLSSFALFKHLSVSQRYLSKTSLLSL